MALTRRMLKEMGLEQDQIDRIMDAHGGTMSDMITKAEAEEMASKSVEQAKAEWQKSLPKERKYDDFDEYKQLKAELDGIRQTEALRGAKVKDKYFDLIRGKVDFTKFDESIQNIKKDYAELFEPEAPQQSEQTPPKQPFPAFGAPAGQDSPPDPQKAAEEQIRKAFRII